MPMFTPKGVGNIGWDKSDTPTNTQVVTFDSTKNLWDAQDAGGGGGGFTTVFKTADESITSDTTLTDDTDLQFDPDISSTFAIQTMISFKTDTTPDFKYNFSIPSGATGDRIDGGWAGGTFETVTSLWTGQELPTVAGTQTFFFNHIGYLITDTTAGTFAFQWAQQTSSATPTTVNQGSWMMFKKLN